jgi:rRNA maturation endonuclease Nob1
MAKRRKATPAEIAKARRMRSNGSSLEEIAKELGFSNNAVHEWTRGFGKRTIKKKCKNCQEWFNAGRTDTEFCSSRCGHQYRNSQPHAKEARRLRRRKPKS